MVLLPDHRRRCSWCWRSANTAFADFPRLTRAIAIDNYMPHVFLIRGRRLLYSWGIYVLVALTALLLILFGGVTDRLIPLYAIGAFMAFTLSQAGMVMHWKRQGGATPAHDRQRRWARWPRASPRWWCWWRSSPRARGSRRCLMLVMILFMRAVNRHYVRVNREIDLDRPIVPAEVTEPIVVVPIDRWSRITEKALSFALSMSSDIRCVHVQTGDEPDYICDTWDKDIAAPLRLPARCIPKLVKSAIALPLCALPDRGLCVECGARARKLARCAFWSRAGGAPLVGGGCCTTGASDLLKVILLMRGNRRIIVINIPWYLEKG